MNLSDVKTTTTSSKVAELESLQLKNRNAVRSVQYLELDSPRLSIINLMMITTICAVTLTVVTSVGFFGVHGLLVVCLIVNIASAEYLREAPVSFRFWNQFIWCMLMPIVCITGDQFVFGQFELGRIVYVTNYGMACYTFVGWQITFLAISWFVSRNNDLLNALVAGTFLSGSLFAFIVAFCLIPFTALGIVAFGIGLPGITPWLTAIVFFRSAKMHTKRLADNYRFAGTMMIVGFTLPILGACFAYIVAVHLKLENVLPSGNIPTFLL